MRKTIGLLCMSLLGVVTSYAAKVTTVRLELTDSSHHVLGSVAFQDTSLGLLITPKLEKLPPGLHGFHLHQHANCSEQGMAAGGHFDPEHTNTHQGPYGHGHLGDLPVLYVDAKGYANTPTLAPRLKVTDLKHLAVMVHQHGDNYTDTPPLGGGGARLACGVVSEHSVPSY